VGALIAEYDGQRATAGLIITERTSPSPNGLVCVLKRRLLEGADGA
jgi:hypothetical protein